MCGVFVRLIVSMAVGSSSLLCTLLGVNQDSGFVLSTPEIPQISAQKAKTLESNRSSCSDPPHIEKPSLFAASSRLKSRKLGQQLTTFVALGVPLVSLV